MGLLAFYEFHSSFRKKNSVFAGIMVRVFRRKSNIPRHILTVSAFSRVGFTALSDYSWRMSLADFLYWLLDAYLNKNMTATNNVRHVLVGEREPRQLPTFPYLFLQT